MEAALGEEGLETQLSTRTATGDGDSKEREPDGPPLPAGTTIGAYSIIELIAEGGMGRVYLAEHARLGRRVALKVLRPRYSEDKSTLHRFFEEARAVNQIQHEHIIQVTDFLEDEENGSCYVMELLEGRTLGARVKDDGPLPIRDVVRIGADVASALAAAHAHDIVHRDLKPDNIYLANRGGEREYVKLLDFGIAKLGSNEEANAMGTPAYMAPEQLEGRVVDARADVYALGVVLYEMLSGTRPFHGRSAGELLIKHATETAPALPVKEHNIPPALAELVGRCLAKLRDERPASAAEVESALRALHVAPAEKRSRARTVALGAGLIVALGIAFVAGRSPSTEQATPAVAATPPPAPAPPTEIELRFSSTPTGAQVQREGGGEPLGTTPFTATLPRTEGSGRFVFTHPERGSLTTTASLASSSAVEVSFPDLPEPTPPPATTTPKTKPPVTQPTQKRDPPTTKKPARARDGRAVILDPFAGE